MSALRIRERMRTWTYRSHSDSWGPYGRYVQLSQEELKMIEMATVTDYTQGKSGLAAWMVSNCGLQLRISLIRETKTYIRFHVIGGCSSLFGQSGCCLGKRGYGVKKYKFYLSLENALNTKPGVSQARGWVK